MNRAINKKLIAIIAIVALVAILGVCLVACNADDYVKRLEKKGYKVEAVTAEDLSIEDAEIEWAVTGIKGSISLNGIEGDMVAAAKYLFDIAVGIDRGVGMGGAAELLENKTRFGGGRSRRAVAVAGQFGKDAPHGAGLQRHDDLRARRAAHAVDDRQIAVERRFVEQVTGRRYFGKNDHRHGSFRKNSHKINKNRRSATISAADFYGK